MSESTPIFVYLRRLHETLHPTVYLRLPANPIEQAFGAGALYPRIFQPTFGRPIAIFRVPLNLLSVDATEPSYHRFLSAEDEATWTTISLS